MSSGVDADSVTIKIGSTVLEKGTDWWFEPGSDSMANGTKKNFNLYIKINGKVKARITVAADADQEAVKAVALEAVQDAVAGKDLKKVVVVPGRLVNIVAK